MQRAGYKHTLLAAVAIGGAMPRSSRTLVAGLGKEASATARTQLRYIMTLAPRALGNPAFQNRHAHLAQWCALDQHAAQCGQRESAQISIRVRSRAAALQQAHQRSRLAAGRRQRGEIQARLPACGME